MRRKKKKTKNEKKTKKRKKKEKKKEKKEKDDNDKDGMWMTAFRLEILSAKSAYHYSDQFSILRDVTFQVEGGGEIREGGRRR